jgi:hypothetical protein
MQVYENNDLCINKWYVVATKGYEMHIFQKNIYVLVKMT